MCPQIALELVLVNLHHSIYSMHTSLPQRNQHKSAQRKMYYRENGGWRNLVNFPDEIWPPDNNTPKI